MGRRPLIPVLPKNYRSIVLHAVSVAKHPRVLANHQPVKDFSESGPLTQKNILGLRNLEVRDGANPVLGFHDHPRHMWISANYSELASHCQSQGWLKIER